MIGIRKDCFAYVDDGEKRYCSALKCLYCMFEDCEFYKKSSEDVDVEELKMAWGIGENKEEN